MIKKRDYTLIFAVVIVVICVFAFLLLRERNNSKPINILLITVDALRPDHLSCYGYERHTSPNIDKLSKEGIRFTQAIAAGGWTIESLPSILTGTYSLTHQIHAWGDLRNLSVKTLAWELVIKGYQCVLWSNHGSMRGLDIKDGFQRVYSVDVRKNYKKTDYVLTNQIINRLKNQYRNHPFFFYIHYEGCHVPYLPPAPYKYMYLHDKFRKKSESIPISNRKDRDERYTGNGKIPYVAAKDNITDPNYYISQYDGAISYTDAQIGRLMDGLKELGLDKNTLVILTADHGEMLGEHNIYFDHQRSYEENIRVPLIIIFPKLFPRGKVISKQVSLIDIAPTILEIAGLKRPSYMQGESLLAFIKPFKSYPRKYALSFFTNQKDWIAIRAKDWKLIYNNANELELYNLRDDPMEQHNLITKRPDKFRQLKQELDNFIKCATPLTPPRKGPPLIEEAKEHLRSLGYAQ